MVRGTAGSVAALKRSVAPVGLPSPFAYTVCLRPSAGATVQGRLVLMVGFVVALMQADQLK